MMKAFFVCAKAQDDSIRTALITAKNYKDAFDTAEDEFRHKFDVMQFAFLSFSYLGKRIPD